MGATNADLRVLCEEVRRLEETDGPWMGVLRSGDSGTVAQVLSTATPLLAGECERLLGRVAEAEAAIWGLLCALGNHERAALDLMSMKWFAEAERDNALRRTREAEADADRYGERAEKAEAEAARLRQEADEARESMEYAYEKKRALDAEVERLRAVIETAPHGPWCDGELRLTGRCDCWKSRALVPAGAERSKGK